uniref:Uncharacterized protein n=1 Tax=Bracon brevicornis TaxID=1563983 RepID=A0A6V7JIT9_9HYME
MVDCQSVQEFKYVFTLTCLVALNPFGDHEVNCGDARISAFEARNRLTDMIAIRGPIMDHLEKLGEETKIKDLSCEHQSQEKKNGKLSKTQEWLTMIIKMITPSENPADSTGTDNAFYMPSFVEQLEVLARSFPLWTGAAVPNVDNHASSAFQEGYFGDLQNRVFSNIKLPCSAYRFLHTHLEDIMAGNNLIAAKLLHYNHQMRRSVSPALEKEPEVAEKEDSVAQYESTTMPSIIRLDGYDSDFEARMLWKGLNNPDHMFFELIEDEVEKPPEEAVESLEKEPQVAEKEDSVVQHKCTTMSTFVNTTDIISDILSLEAAGRDFPEDTVSFDLVHQLENLNKFEQSTRKPPGIYMSMNESPALSSTTPVTSSTPIRKPSDILQKVKVETVQPGSLKASLKEGKKSYYFAPCPELRILN